MSEQTFARNDVMAALCLWESMLDAARAEKDAAQSQMVQIWEDVGSYEMRNHAMKLGPIVDRVWGMLPESVTYGHDFDWELCPDLIPLIDWNAASLPHPEPLAARIADKWAKVKLSDLGFELWGNAGNGLAWRKVLTGGRYVLATGPDGSGPFPNDGENWLIALHDDVDCKGDFEAKTVTDIAAGVARWEAPANEIWSTAAAFEWAAFVEVDGYIERCAHDGATGFTVYRRDPHGLAYAVHDFKTAAKAAKWCERLARSFNVENRGDVSPN